MKEQSAKWQTGRVFLFYLISLLSYFVFCLVPGVIPVTIGQCAIVEDLFVIHRLRVFIYIRPSNTPLKLLSIEPTWALIPSSTRTFRIRWLRHSGRTSVCRKCKNTSPLFHPHPHLFLIIPVHHPTLIPALPRGVVIRFLVPHRWPTTRFTHNPTTM